MEHKLLLGGGEKYLPFARSRIKALRAAGLEYATQRFLLPDARIRVQLVGPDVDYIEIIGGETVTIEMDSGVVDVGSIAEFGLQTYAPGTLYETAHVAAYNAGFVLPESGLPPRLKDTPGTSAGQFSGILTKATRFAGRVPVDGQIAMSFEQGKISDFQTPPTWIRNTRDETLKAKKTIAVLCPASMFTGRCRLWVQAMYGAFLYDGPDSAQVAQMPYALTFTGTSQPALVVTNRNKRTADEIESGVSFADVTVTTGSGVHLDPATGKHWLFCFTAGAKVYPLIAPKAIERLRQYLITTNPPDGIEALSDDDREHLEAYILSKSLPNGDTSIAGTASSPFSMGYSWHWNWDGLVADAVVSEQYEQTYPAGAMRSTWYRITMTLTDGAWSVLQTTVEGPTDWAVSRAYWTITEPNYGTFQADKITPKFSNLFACDAPVYVFYRRNEIQVCRVSLVSNAPGADTRETSPNFSNSATPFTGDRAPRRTLGLGGGHLLDRRTDSSYWSATFTAGTVSLGPLYLGRTETNWKETISEKVPGSWFTGFGGYIVPALSTESISYGPPLVDLTILDYNYAQFTFVGGTVDDEDQSQQVTYTHSRGDESVVYASRATMAVPFYDAEAIYVEGYGEQVSTWQPQVSSYTTQVFGFIYVQRTLFTPTGSPQLILEKTAWRGTGFTESAPGSLQVNSETNETIVTNTQTVDGSFLVGHPGEVAATFTNLSQFHNNALESVDAPMYTLTGTRDDLALATGNIEPVGMPATNPDAPVIVGWV